MNVEYLDQSDEEKITEILMGRRVVDVDLDTGIATLDNEVVLQLMGNEGGCSCGAGDYDLSVLNRVDNVITNVEFEDDPDSDYEDGVGYKIFVYAEDERINFAEFEGSDGNGYYGTGYQIRVTFPVVQGTVNKKAL